MSSTPNTPGETTTTYVETAASSLPRWVTLLFVVAFALVAYLLYAGYADRQAARKGMDDAERKTQALATELDKTNSRIADLKGQLDVTSQKLGLTQDELAQARSLAQTIKKDQQKSDAKLRSEIAGVQADTSTKIGEVTTELSGTKSEADATKTVDDWTTSYNNLKAELEQKANVAAQNLSCAAIWSFFALLIGLLVTGFGGALGARFAVWHATQTR